MAKIDATNYNTNWVTPSAGGGGLTLPLTQNLTFSPDGTYDMGVSGSRPRDINMSRTLNAGGHGIFAGEVSASGTVYSATSIAVGNYNTTLSLSGTDLVVTISSSARWKFTTSGLLASADATYDIGASGANRPRTVFASGDVVVPSVITSIVGSVTGTALSFRVNSNVYWNIHTSGHLLANFDNTYDIGAVGATRPRTIYAATSFVGPGAVPTGGTTNQVLAKTSATDYALSWQTPSAGGITIPLGQNLTFSPDATYDIGASGATRPRDLFLSRNLAVGGTSTLTGNVGVGGATLASTGLNVVSPALTTNSQVGVSASPVFSSAATSLGSALDAKLTTAAAAFTMANGYGLRIPAPALGAGSAVTVIHGIHIANQGGAGRTFAYGLFIAAQSGASSDNYALYAASQSWFEKGLGIGGDNFGNPLANTYLLFNSSLPVSLTGTSQYGIRFGTIGWNAPTATAAVISTVGAVQMQGTAATLTNHYHLQLGGTIPNGWAITNAYGINVANQGAAGVVNAYGLYIANQTGASTNNVGLRNLGTSLFDGVATFTVAPVLPNAAIANAKLAADTARANLLVNGGFEIWQRGNGPFTGFVTGPDRWALNPGAGATMSVVRDSTNVDPNGSSQYAAAVTYTHGSAESVLYQLGGAAGSPETTFIRSRTITGSVRVRTSTANAVRLAIYDVTAATFVYGAYHTGDNTWQTLTVSRLMGAGGGDLRVAFNASCTAYLDNAMLVVGSQAADYAPLHPADDLARCQRYYEAVAAGSNQYVGLAFAYGTTTAMGMWQMMPKAAAPTVTTSPAATWGVTNSGFGVVVCSGMGPVAQAGRMISFGITVAGGLVGGNAAMMLGATGQTATLTVEANP